LDLRWRKRQQDKKYCKIMSFITCKLHQYYWGDQISEDEMDGACRTHGRHEKFVININRKT